MSAPGAKSRAAGNSTGGAPAAGTPAGGGELARLLAPLALERFFAEHWEARHLLVERGDPGFYDRLFTLADVDRALHVARSCPVSVLAMAPPQGTEGERFQLPVAEVPSELIYRNVAAGYSLRLGRVDRLWPTLGMLQAALREELSTAVHIELYLTPASTQGVVPHYDNRDVFVLQLHGAKRWHLGAPDFDLPGLGLNHVTDRVPSQLLGDQESRLDRSVLLRAGDLLYLPRGVYHRPVAEDETSLHLSVAIYPLGWSDLLRHAVDRTAKKQPLLGRSLPPGFPAAGAEARREMATTFAEAARTYTRRAPFEAAFAAVARDSRHAELYPPDGHFAALARIESVDVDTVVERRRGLTCLIERVNGNVTLRFGPNHLSGPAAMAPTFDFIRHRRRFRVGELPGPLADDNRKTLARRLLREGLLRIADPDPGATA